MFITLGTASEYVFQNLSNVLSLKEWFPNNNEKMQTVHRVLFFQMFCRLYLLLRELEMALKYICCTRGNYINSSVFSCVFSVL